MRANNGFGDTVAIRHEIEQIAIYEVTETELTMLDSYAISDIILDAAIATTTLCATTILSMIVVDFGTLSKLKCVIFLAVCIASGLVAVISWIIWGFTKKNKHAIIKQIKDRKAIIASES